MKVSVYLASSEGNSKKFSNLAFCLGNILAKEGYEVIYGGANVGCMKALADGVSSAGGHLIGVFPEGFKGKPEYAHRGIDVIRHDVSEMFYATDFLDRKKIMEDLSDCCVVLPGSWGTLDEMFTYMADRALGFHNKPSFILDLDGYYSPIKQMLANMENSGFMGEEYQSDVRFFPDMDSLVKALNDFANNK